VSQLLLDDLRRELRARPNPNRATQAAAYMKVALPFLGLALPAVRRIAKHCLRQHPLEDARAYRSFMRAGFMKATYQEERYAVLAVAGEKRSRPFQTAEVLPVYEQLIIAAAWWDLVDDLSCRVGEVLLAAPRETARTLRTWARHPNIWFRRSAIVCQRKLKEQTNVSLLFACLEPSLAENEFFLRKGIGWALRALAYHAPDEVRSYVKANATRLSPLSKKEALKHLSL